jgi:hypothetical protein
LGSTAQDQFIAPVTLSRLQAVSAGVLQLPNDPSGYAPVVAYDVHIRTSDGGVQYPNALSYGIKDQALWVQVQAGEDEDGSDTIYFSPSYWQQYSVNPHSDDPLDLCLDELEELADLDELEDLEELEELEELDE